MRCIFCQNAPLVLCPEKEEVTPTEEFFSFLEKRKGILQGVCISGGEPTLEDDLTRFMSEIKERGLLVKLDTNGLRPRILEQILKSDLADMVAMDIKSEPEDYPRITGISPESIERVKESAAMLMESGIEYEFRTTVPGGVFSDENFEHIGQWLKGARAYYIQAFRDSGACLAAGLKEPEDEELERFCGIVGKYIPSACIRGR